MTTLPEKITAVLDAAFASRNALVPAADRVTGYLSYIPGSPTNLFWVLYCPEPRRDNSTVDGLSRDANGKFQVTVAASRPASDASPAAITNRLVRGVLDALVDLTITDVDGLGPFTIQQDDVDTYPVTVEVVRDRVTVEQALPFKYLADRI